MILWHSAAKQSVGDFHMPVTDLCREDVVTAGPEDSVQDLASTLDSENVGSIVITNDESPVGIVTDRDLATRALTANPNPNGMTAEDVMTDELVTVHREAGFYEAARAMSENGIRRLPVCDESGAVCGIITADDVSELLADEQQQLAQVIREQRPPY